MRTQIGIIGAGPAGLFLAHLLHRAGIASVIVETRPRDAVERTIRAGMLEDWVVRLLREMGLADRLDREAHFHNHTRSVRTYALLHRPTTQPDLFNPK